MTDETKDALQNEERYKNFTILDKPVKFNELFNNKDFDCVQVHSTQVIKHENKHYFVGFCGVFSWLNNTLKSLDGDSYNEEMTVCGYKYFVNKEKNVHSGIDILVGDDW